MKSFTCPQISELSGPPPTAHPTLRLLLGPSGAPKPESSLSDRTERIVKLATLLKASSI